MSHDARPDDHDGPTPLERELDIVELKNAAIQAAGGDMSTWEAEDAPAEIREQFWKNVLEYEQAPLTTHFDQLKRAGLELPPENDLDDAPTGSGGLETRLHDPGSWRAYAEQRPAHGHAHVICSTVRVGAPGRDRHCGRRH